MPRFKILFSRLGLDTSGNADIYPKDVLGKVIGIDTFTEKYTKTDGSEGVANRIRFDGFIAIEEAEKDGTPENPPPF